jgi:hypothetical protein
MKTLIAILCLLSSPLVLAQTTDTLGLWHMDESSGAALFDSSPLHNNGTAFGATIVPGVRGNARYFNGSGNYATVPSNAAYNFDPSQSFTVVAWVKTSQPEGIIVRRGLDPIPGFQLSIHFGRAIGRIGNTLGHSWTDTLLTLTSTQPINDNVWHELRMVRDRSQTKLFLYVDGVSSTPPQDDFFSVPLTNDRPLTLGASLILPDYFTGPIDEVAILRGAHHPVTIISDTLGLWHLDEAAGQTLFDSSPYHNNGSAFGTTIVPGRYGNARSFNGFNDYVMIPSLGAYNFENNQSFTVRAWFKTWGTEGIMVRRGLVPYPGIELAIHLGYAVGIIGNYKGTTWSDTLLTLTSTQLVNDGAWHELTMVRDRTAGKLFLYLDGLPATTPQDDNFTIPLISNRPLTFGAWEIQRDFFTGAIDEVAIFRGARHPVNISLPIIQVSPLQLNFGNVLVGSQTVRDAFVTNIGFHDTLQISVQTTNPVFSASIPITYPIPPGVTRNVPVLYLPTAARTDTGSLMISSNDPNRPLVRVPLNGQGFAPTAAPFILSIRDIPEDQGKQVRVIWYKSVHDTVGDSLRIGQYNLWRRVGANNNLWDFIATIPAARFQQYSYVAPTLFDSSRTLGIRWSVFKVSAHTASGSEIYFSAADSGYSVDNIPPNAPANLSGTFVAGRVNLSWDAPPDPDIEMYAVYRSTIPDFVPSVANQIGTTPTNSFVDQNIGGGSAFYYRVAALDTTGNLGAVSSQVRVVVTDVGGGNTLPTEFALFQNYPNPFNPSSVVRYDVPFTAHVTIKVFDVLGKEVATLVDEQKSAGTHEVRMTAGSLASGVYIYRMQSGEYVSVKKMILMK